MNTYTIRLDELSIYGHHGWHEEEGITGAMFKVSVSIDFAETLPITKLEQTINYVSVYDMVKEVMKTRVKLLETIVEILCNKIAGMHTGIKTITVSVVKLNPPIQNFVGNVSVSLTKSYS